MKRTIALEKVMNGDLDDILKALRTAEKRRSSGKYVDYPLLHECSPLPVQIRRK